MWYEVLPSLGIVYVLLTIPAFTNKAVCWLFYNGKTSVRYWEGHNQDFHLFLRDRRLTGSEYVPKGLEGIKENFSARK